MSQSFSLDCGASSLQVAFSRIDLAILHAILKQLYPSLYPLEPIKSVAEAEAIRDRACLIMRIVFWANDEKPRVVPRSDFLGEIQGALEKLETERDALVCRYTNEQE